MHQYAHECTHSLSLPPSSLSLSLFLSLSLSSSLSLFLSPSLKQTSKQATAHRSECNTRGLASYRSSSVPVDALALNMNPGGGADAAPGGGILGQMSLAMRGDIDLLPLKFLVRLSDSVSATSSSRTPAYPPPRDPEAVHTAPAKGREGAAATSAVRTIEIVVGAAWKDHGAIERFMDRVAGSGSRLSPGLWQVSAHLKRVRSSVGLVRFSLYVASRTLANLPRVRSFLCWPCSFFPVCCVQDPRELAAS